MGHRTRPISTAVMIPTICEQRRRELATEAATAVLRTTLDPNQTNDQKMAAVEVILDQYLSYAPGCTFDNNWCQAPERQYGNGQGIGSCSVGGSGEPDFGLGMGSHSRGLVTLVRRARRRRGGVARSVSA